jgi:ankyrin repeat protein
MISNKDIVKLLISIGATVNTQNKNNGMTTLMFACDNNKKDNVEIVELLLSKGVQVNLQNKDGMTDVFMS